MTGVSGTGHRWSTPRNPDGLNPADRPWLEERARFCLGRLVDHNGVTEVWTGMAQGWDLVLAVEAIGLGLPVVAHVPFVSQAERWPREQRAEWEWVRARVVDAVTYGPDPQNREQAVGLLHTRNDGLLRADLLFACLMSTKRSGGTWSAVEKAQGLGLGGVHLDPVTRRTRIVGPGGWFERQEAPHLW